MSVTFEYVVSTALAAFFASLAAVAVTYWLSIADKRQNARAEILRAIARHIDRLWEYSVNHGAARTAGIGNLATFNGQFAPFKPTTAGLAAEVIATRPYFSGKQRQVIDEIVSVARRSEVENKAREELADWQKEVQALQDLARRVAHWDGRNHSLPA